MNARTEARGWHRYHQGDADALTARARMYAATALAAYTEGDTAHAYAYAERATALATLTGDTNAADLAAIVTRWRAEAIARDALAEVTP